MAMPTTNRARPRGLDHLGEHARVGGRRRWVLVCMQLTNHTLFTCRVPSAAPRLLVAQGLFAGLVFGSLATPPLPPWSKQRRRQCQDLGKGGSLDSSSG